jgi:hypothetical protein
MRIGLFRHSLFSRGGDRIVVQYANYLAEHGHDVTIFVNEIDTSFTMHERVRLRKIPLRTKLGTLVYGTFARFGAGVVVVDIIPLAFLLGLFHRVVYLAQAHDVLYYQRPTMRRLIAWFYQQVFSPVARSGHCRFRILGVAVQDPLPRDQYRRGRNRDRPRSFLPDPQPRAHFF